MARRPTMPDVAKAAGVSVMTVSYAYNRPDRVAAATRERVLAAAAELGYAGPNPAARNLRHGRTGNLGVILGENLTYAFADPQATAFLGGVATICTERGFGLTLIPVSGAAEDADRVRAAAVDGYVLWTTVDDDPVLAVVQESGLPGVVQSGPAVTGLGVIGIDDRAAARAIGAVGLRGAFHPAVLSFPLDRRREPQLLHGPDPSVASYQVTRDRLSGYRAAVEAAGLEWRDVPVLVLGRNEAAEADRALDDLPDGVDAVLAMSDELALAALRTVDRAAVTVTGWDDTPAAEPAGLTTVAQSLHDQGRACAAYVVDGTAPDPPEWRIVERASTR